MITSINFKAFDHNDRKLFFEALGEYGKDFQNIQQYMSQKCGKSANKSQDQEKKEQDKKEDDKKREQIRKFYSKLYRELSPLLGKFDDRITQVNQELYLLINCGEIWKKHGFKHDLKINNKTKKLLEELVYKGYTTTTLRFNSKNIHLRTPSCKALKKINEIGVDEKVKVVTMRELPKDVVVELHPASNKDWLRVQSMSQNPRVRARLPIQKRISNVLQFLDTKWNLTHEKLGRTIDLWLKVPSSNQISNDDYQSSNGNNSYGHNIGQEMSRSINSVVSSNDLINGTTVEQNQPLPSLQADFYSRLRLKPSMQHKLNEVNITRVVPDNHLDLSLDAYLKRLSESKPEYKNCDVGSKSSTSARDLPNNLSNNDSERRTYSAEYSEHSQGANSRLPVSLTTPDCSILLEKSQTSEQPSIVQARKNLNLLQCIAGSFGVCENSRTACEDTQDRSLLQSFRSADDNKSHSSIQRVDGTIKMDHDSSPSATNMIVNHNIPALFDEDAAIDSTLIQTNTNNQCAKLATLQQDQSMQRNCSSDAANKQNLDCQNSKSVDFQIPENVTLRDWFKMAEHGGDDANDSFAGAENAAQEVSGEADSDKSGQEVDIHEQEEPVREDACANGNQVKPQNHMIEIEKIAKGWTRDDDTSMTVGELYLAFKCPDKIILEYEFEQCTYDELPQVFTESSESSGAKLVQGRTSPSVVKDDTSNESGALMLKLLAAANLSLAQIERQKQEQKHRMNDQQPKFKKRKGSGQGQAMTLHDIETRNQRVEEALKQLQPTRLRVYRRA